MIINHHLKLYQSVEESDLLSVFFGN